MPTSKPYKYGIIELQLVHKLKIINRIFIKTEIDCGSFIFRTDNHFQTYSLTTFQQNFQSVQSGDVNKTDKRNELEFEIKPQYINKLTLKLQT